MITEITNNQKLNNTNAAKSPKAKVVVADDINETLDLVCKLINEYCPNVEIVGRYRTLEATQLAVDILRPDILMLDIQFVAEGKTAFDFLDHFKQNNSLTFNTIIFSGHCEVEYYEMAFRYNVIHFLSKPIDKDRLIEAIDRAISNTNTLLPIAPANYQNNTLKIATALTTHIIELKDIVYMQSREARTFIVLCNNDEIASSRNIGYFEKQIAHIGFFARINNDTIVNINYICGFSNRIDKKILLKQPFGKLKCSRERFNSVMKMLKM